MKKNMTRRIEWREINSIVDNTMLTTHSSSRRESRRLDGAEFFFFFFPGWDDKSNFMLFKVKSYYIFQHEGISYIIYLFDNSYFGHLCMRPQKIVLFKDQLEEGILNRITFNAKREEFRAASGTSAAAHAACQQAKERKKSIPLNKSRKLVFSLVTLLTDREVLYTCTCTLYNTLPLLFFAFFPPIQTKVPVLSLMRKNSVINCFLTNSTQSSSFLTSQGGFCIHDCLHLHQQPVHKKIEHLVVCRTVGVTIDLRGRPECQTCSLF